VVTCLTVQDTRNVYGATAVDPELIRQQLECLSKDIAIDAVKTGAMGNAAIVEVVREFLDRQPDTLPLIVDPVIKAAGGGDLADEELLHAMKTRLFPRAEMLTPNGEELVQLGGNNDEAEAAKVLLKTGCRSVLGTGGHGTGPRIINTLYTPSQPPTHWEIERIGHNEYHGTGCTLAAAIAAGMASGLSARTAIAQAQNYVHRTLVEALCVGQGQKVPDRGILWER